MKLSNYSRFKQFKQKRWVGLAAIFSLMFVGFFVAIKSRREENFASPPFYDTRRNLEPLTIHCNGGRLGNQMCTLASLYGLTTLNGRRMMIPPCNHERLKKYFDLHIPVVDMETFQEKNPWHIKPYLTTRDQTIDPDSNIIKGYPYPCSYTFFNHVRKEIKQLFNFKPEIQKYAQEALAKARGNWTNVVFVGVHVRRTDYLGTQPGHWLHAFQGKSVDTEYFEKATKYYRNKYDNVLFVAVSDDREWCRENLEQFGIRVLDDAPSPAHDIATLANCNHTIMTYGTFGFWGGYLAGGEVVYFDKYLKPNTEFTKNEFLFDKMYLPQWVGIETESGHPE